MALPRGDEARELAQGLRTRNPELLDQLVERFHYRLLRYLIALTANPILAEDLFQETWLRVLERGRQYKPEYRFESWLFAIARHLFLDRVRRKPEIGLGALAGEDEDAFDLADPCAPSPYDTYRRLEESQGLQRALLGLSAVYREVLVLRFQEDLDLQEIAAVTGAPLPTVKSRLYRGLAALQRQLQPGGRV
ncbi:MAG TPA: RNA polymerase sigma factor [Terriglobales bacterium]|nr:RNA polymerase sigma factor [Terriglobales bacterium]